MPRQCRLDNRGFYIEHRDVAPYDGLPESWIWAEPPAPGTVAIWVGDEWVYMAERPAELEPFPELIPGPKLQVSKREFRELLRQPEALWYDQARANTPALTLEQIETLSAGQADLPLIIQGSLRDAFLQWDSMTLIELDHQDTREFLEFMGFAGMFGPNAADRIAQITCRQSPTA